MLPSPFVVISSSSSKNDQRSFIIFLSLTIFKLFTIFFLMYRKCARLIERYINFLYQLSLSFTSAPPHQNRINTGRIGLNFLSRTNLLTVDLIRSWHELHYQLIKFSQSIITKVKNQPRDPNTKHLLSFESTIIVPQTIILTFFVYTL